MHSAGHRAGHSAGHRAGHSAGHSALKLVGCFRLKNDNSQGVL